MSERTLNITAIRHLIRPILWDYNIDPYDLFLVARGEMEQIGGFDGRKALLRMLERLSWYDLVNLFGTEQLRTLLTSDVIARLRLKEQREKYEFVRKVLRGEPVSVAGWSPEYREKIKHTLLSHRWYRTQ